MTTSIEKPKLIPSDFSRPSPWESITRFARPFSLNTELDESVCIEVLKNFPLKGKDASEYHILLDDESSPRRFRITQMVADRERSPYKLDFLEKEVWRPNCFILGEIYGDPNMQGVHLRGMVYSGNYSYGMFFGGLMLLGLIVYLIVEGGWLVCTIPFLLLFGLGMMIDPYYERQRFVEMVKTVIREAEKKG